MSGLLVDKDLCIGCGLCVKACGNAGIVVEGERPNRFAHATDGCILCGACVQACPKKAISIARDEDGDETPQQRASRLAAYRDVWVFAQVDQTGRALPVAFELLGRARELAAIRGCRVVALLGQGATAPQDQAPALLAAGADEVLLCRDDRLATLDARVYAHWICDMAGERKPEIVLYGATAFGRELAPGVAVRLQTGLTADCTVLDIDPATGLLQQTRPAFGGNLMATIVTPRTRPQMATVRPGVMEKLEKDASKKGRLVKVEAHLKADDINVEVLDVVKEAKELVSLTDAQIICSGGRGLGNAEGFELIKEFANKVGGVVGASRAAVDSGWIDASHQVGQTGTTVKPKIYFACGISGAIQHLAGMQTSDIIIAINKDPEAPMMQLADYAICGDLKKVIPEIIAQWDAE